LERNYAIATSIPDRRKHRRLKSEAHHWSRSLREALIAVCLAVGLVVVWLRHKLVVVRV